MLVRYSFNVDGVVYTAPTIYNGSCRLHDYSTACISLNALLEAIIAIVALLLCATRGDFLLFLLIPNLKCTGYDFIRHTSSPLSRTFANPETLTSALRCCRNAPLQTTYRHVSRTFFNERFMSESLPFEKNFGNDVIKPDRPFLLTPALLPVIKLFALY